MGVKYCGVLYLFWLGRWVWRVDGMGLCGGGEWLGGSLLRLFVVVGKLVENWCFMELD